MPTGPSAASRRNSPATRSTAAAPPTPSPSRLWSFRAIGKVLLPPLPSRPRCQRAAAASEATDCVVDRANGDTSMFHFRHRQTSGLADPVPCFPFFFVAQGNQTFTRSIWTFTRASWRSSSAPSAPGSWTTSAKRRFFSLLYSSWPGNWQREAMDLPARGVLREEGGVLPRHPLHAPHGLPPPRLPARRPAPQRHPK